MRDYIILNGVNSNTITGLLISTLPPITKPKIRTQTEEIDGRDGDIVTKLGYSAYDKEIQIGLYGNFDVNQVIAYFNTSGTVTFSNEPDKYYNYQILDQIDYEKLIRFKTAKIKMHVQPFKYPLEETPVEINIQNVTNEAEEMDLDNTAEAPLTLALKGNTSQDGTPTPEAPVEVNTVTGRQEIIISNGTDTQSYELDLGKNIFNGIIEQGTYDGSTGEKSGSNAFYRNANKIPVQPSTTYTFSLNGTSQRYVVLFYGINQQFISQNSSLTTGTFTTPNNAYYVNFRCFQSDYKDDYATLKIQLEKGSEVTNYVQYKIPIEINNIPNTEYQDYFFKDNNKWYIKRQVGKVVLKGNEDRLYQATTQGGGVRFEYRDTTFLNTTANNVVGPLISNYFKPITVNQTYTNIVGVSYRNKDDIGGVYFYDGTHTTIADFKTWLGNNNVSIYYVLTTPEDEEITDNTLIGQLNALENARSYDTTTNISQNTVNKPFIINATAVQKGSDTGTVNNIGNIYAKPTIDIEGSGTVEIYLNGNQMFSVDLSSSNECIIDTANLEAYNPETTQLMNRQVTGDYSNFIINTGENTVKVSGNVTKATISNYTRWL